MYSVCLALALISTLDVDVQRIVPFTHLSVAYASLEKCAWLMIICYSRFYNADDDCLVE